MGNEQICYRIIAKSPYKIQLALWCSIMQIFGISIFLTVKNINIINYQKRTERKEKFYLCVIMCVLVLLT